MSSYVNSKIEKAEAEFRNRIKIYLLLATVIIFLIIGILLLRNNRHKQKANKLLQHLRSTQAQLIQSEKMASLGELTARIALVYNLSPQPSNFKQAPFGSCRTIPLPFGCNYRPCILN